MCYLRIRLKKEVEGNTTSTVDYSEQSVLVAAQVMFLVV